MQDGPRLENMSWRLWHKERTAQFNLSSPHSPLTILDSSLTDEWSTTKSCFSNNSVSSTGIASGGASHTNNTEATNLTAMGSNSGSGTITHVSRSPEHAPHCHHHHHRRHGHADHTHTCRPRRTLANSDERGPEDKFSSLKRNSTSSSSMHTDRSRITIVSTSLLSHHRHVPDRIISSSPHRLSTPSTERRPSLASCLSQSTTIHAGKIMAKLIPSKFVVSTGKPNGARVTITSDRDHSSVISLSTVRFLFLSPSIISHSHPILSI